MSRSPSCRPICRASWSPSHPAYDSQFDGFAPAKGARQSEGPPGMGGQPDAGPRPRPRVIWGSMSRCRFPARWPSPISIPGRQRPAGLIEEAFDELAKRWKPILDAYDEVGVDVGYEIHPGEDLFDGATFEMFLERLKGHRRCTINYDPSHFLLQQMDYLAFIDIYHERISAFHVKDAEFNPTGRQGGGGGGASIPATRAGSTAPAASGRWATGRSISPASSPSSPSMATNPGPCWNGNAA